MLPQFLGLLAKPFLKAIPVKPEVKDKFNSLAKILTGGSGEAWIAVARQQATLPFAEASEAQSQLPSRGEAMLDGKPVAWMEFDWPGECGLANCASGTSAGGSIATASSVSPPNSARKAPVST